MIERLRGSGKYLRPLFSILAGLLIAAIVIQASHYNALEAFSALWTGATGLQGGAASGASQIALGSGHLNLYQLAQSLAKVTPLIFTGLAIALGLRAGLFNIGASGQMLVGALVAALVGQIGQNGHVEATNGTLPPGLHVALTLLAGFAAGAAWGAIPGWLKAKRGVHEVISTIMLNFVAQLVITYLVQRDLKDPAPGNESAQTAIIAKSAWLWPYIPHSALTFGLPLAILSALALTILIRRTALGFQIRAVGLGAEAARAAGIPVPRITVLTLALSGGLAGLAGAVEVMGVHHRYVEGVAGSYGFDGIAVALLGSLSGGGVILSALFFGLLANGATYMQSMVGVPAPISDIMQAMVILFVGGRDWGRKFVGKKASE